MVARQALSAVIAPPRLADEAAVGRDDEPEPTELAHVLAADRAAARVPDVVVEGPAAVRELTAAVLALDRPDRVRVDTVARADRARLVVDRPRAGACSVAGARLAPLVMCEAVEDAALAVEENGAVQGF